MLGLKNEKKMMASFKKTFTETIYIALYREAGRRIAKSEEFPYFPTKIYSI